MKKLTFFITSMSSGGAEHQLAILSDLLSDLHYDVTIVTYANVDDHYKLNDNVTRIKLAEFSANAVVKYFYICKYFLFLDTDCIISFGQRESVLCLLPLLFRKKKIIAGERNFTIGKPNLFEKILGLFLYKKVTYIVPNNRSQAEHLKSFFPAISGKIVPIMNYTDLSVFNVGVQPFNKKRHIGVFGRYASQKNCFRFIEMVKILKEKVGPIFVIEWYGNKYFKGKESDYFLSLKRNIEEYNISDVLLLNNHVQNVKEFIKKFDAICLPSIFEGFSNSIAEGICCGKPMLVSDVSDNSIMVKDGINGFLFDPFNVENMCDAFLKFLTLSNDQLLEMSNNSRKIAEELFDKKKFVSSYVKLIES